jgi:AcrR family transcriptional regulator
MERGKGSDGTAANPPGGDARRASILAAAGKLFSVSFDRTSMKDIGRKVGIDAATIYYYFPSKQAILLEILERGVKQHIEKLQEILSLDVGPRQRLRVAVSAHVELTATASYVELHERYHQLLPAQETLSEMRDRVEMLFDRLIREAASASNVAVDDPALARFFILSGMNVSRWYRPDARLSLEKIGDTFANMVERVIGISDKEDPASSR